ncbi:hypothetical protein [Salinibius halmophilus]|uniref:hypothetical protein n=1 Tax=Salinibius halmophilus TaxID=1853216 RepID=UPI000E671650|nr:hypothetical protein [Salinibius halmophilus]
MQYTFKPQESISTISFAPMSASGVREWLEALPRANVGELSRQLYMALQQLSVLATKPALAAAILQETLPHLEHTAQLLMQKFLLGGRRDAQQAQKAINLIHHFCRLTYRCANNHRVGKMKAHNQTLLATELSILRLDLLAYQMSYMDVSSDYWATFNDLVAECIDNKWLGLETRHGRVADILKSIILLSTAQTNQLLARDIFALSEVLTDWAGETHLQPNNHGILCFPKTNLKPVSNPQIAQKEKAGLSLDTRKLASQLGDAVAGQDINLAIPNSGGLTLLTHVMKAWSGSLARHMQRSVINHNTRCLLGLAAIHQSLDASGEQQALFTSDYKIALDRPDERDVWNEAYRGSFVEAIDLPEQKYRPPMLTAITVTDLSPGGYGIRCNEPPSIFQTGELIGIEQRNNQLHIGLVRWLKQEGSSIKAGVELVSPNAEACLVRITHSSGRDEAPQRGLWLEKSVKGGNQPSLILPSVAFKPGNQVKVDISRKTYLMTLVRKVNASARISVYQVKPVEEQKPIRPNKQPDDGFDSLFEIK